MHIGWSRRRLNQLPCWEEQTQVKKNWQNRSSSLGLLIHFCIPPHLFHVYALYFAKNISTLPVSGQNLTETQMKCWQNSHTVTAGVQYTVHLLSYRPAAVFANWSMAWSMTDCCKPNHAAIKRCLRSFTSCIGVRCTLSCMTPQTMWSTGFKSGLFRGQSSGPMKK